MRNRQCQKSRHVHDEQNEAGIHERRGHRAAIPDSRRGCGNGHALSFARAIARVRELSSTHKAWSFEEFLNLKALCFGGGAWFHGCSDLRFIGVRTLRRRGADLYRDHHAETDQTNNNEPNSASHRHRTY
jgi:hypothetical protein